jgi:hypothetical protein
MPSRVPSWKRPTVPNLQRKRGADSAEWRRRVLNTYRWQQFAARYLRMHPACVAHWARGELVAATQIHHRRGRDIDYAYVESELAALCASCHSEVTVREQHGQTVEIPRAEPVPPDEPTGAYC